MGARQSFQKGVVTKKRELVEHKSIKQRKKAKTSNPLACKASKRWFFKKWC
jgi:hypothetical protein